jgi:hypothetical protein
MDAIATPSRRHRATAGRSAAASSASASSASSTASAAAASQPEDAASVYQLTHELAGAQSALAEAHDENTRLRKMIRDIARQRAASAGGGVGGGGLNNPFVTTTERDNFPAFDAGMAGEHSYAAAQDGGSGLDDDGDDDDDDAQNESGDSFAPLNLSIGGLAAFHGLQDFGVVSPPSMLDSSQSIAALRTPARVIKAGGTVTHLGLPGLRPRNGGGEPQSEGDDGKGGVDGGGVTNQGTPLRMVSPARSGTADLDESAQSPANMADVYRQLMAASREDEGQQQGNKQEQEQLQQGDEAAAIATSATATLEAHHGHKIHLSEQGEQNTVAGTASSPRANDRANKESMASPMFGSFRTPVSSHRRLGDGDSGAREAVGTGRRLQMATPGLSPIQGSQLKDRGGGLDGLEEVHSGNDSDPNMSHLSEADMSMKHLNNSALARSSHGSHHESAGAAAGGVGTSASVTSGGSVSSAAGEVDVLSSSNASHRLKQKLSGVTREMDEDAMSELSSTSSLMQSLNNGSDIKMFSPLKTPGHTPLKAMDESMNNEYGHHVGGGEDDPTARAAAIRRTPGSRVSSRSMIAAENHRMRMSELKQIHDEVSRGSPNVGSSGSRVAPAPLPRARVVGVRRAGENTVRASEYVDAASSSSSSSASSSSTENLRSTGPNQSTAQGAYTSSRDNNNNASHNDATSSHTHQSHSHHTTTSSGANESIMFSQAALTGMRRKRAGPNLGAALWEAKQLGITSPETQMEYARTVTFGSSTSSSSKVPKIMSSHSNAYESTSAGSFSTSTISGTSRFPGMGSSLPLSSLASSLSPRFNATGAATSSHFGSASMLPRRGAIDLPHWYINPESSRTSPKPDPVFDFKSLQVNDHATQFSSSYWASKLGISSARFRRKPGKAHFSPVLGEPMTQRYEYRSPL